MQNQTLYDVDYYGWIQEQALLLRAGQVEQLDFYNLAEEIESLGRQEYNELVSRLKILAGETKLPYKTFPNSCPYTFEQILAPTFPVDLEEWENSMRD